MDLNLGRSILRDASGLVAALLVLLLAVAALQTGAEAKHEEGHVPANKVAVAASTFEVSEPGAPVLLMRTHMRNPASKALQLSVTAECSITTELSNMGDSTADAEGRVDVWVDIVEEDGTRRTVSVAEGEAEQDDGRVTFCNQRFRRTTSFQDDQEHAIDTFLRTKSAAGFNWVDLETGNGIKTVEVWAQLEDTTHAGDATALSVVGRRTLVVEPIDTALGETKTEDDVNDDGGGTESESTSLPMGLP